MTSGEVRRGARWSSISETWTAKSPSAIYDMVLKSVEKPMLEVVLAKAGANQTLAAEMLGINRNTLRKKLDRTPVAC